MRQSPHNHAQTARNLRRSLRNPAAGARLIQAEGLDCKSAAEIAASLAEALEELQRLQRRLDRRIDAARPHAKECRLRMVEANTGELVTGELAKYDRALWAPCGTCALVGGS
jgi:hypothetical protein